MRRRRNAALLCLSVLLLCAACGRAVPSPEPSRSSEEAAVPAIGAGVASVPASQPEAAPAPEPESVPDTPPAPELAPEHAPEAEQAPAPQPAPEPEPPKPANTRLYILMYHEFVEGDGKDCNEWMLPAGRFREDLQWLADHGYETVLPSQVLGGEPLPERAVMLTLDDGTESSYTVAYPILRQFGAKAVISPVVSWVQEGRRGFLTWEECREMAQSGLVEFGSHTWDLHDSGVRRIRGETREDYGARVFPDLLESAELLESNLGAAPLLFAYPHGWTDSWATEFLTEHFGMTVTTRYGPANLARGLYNLPRHNVSLAEPPAFHLPA